MSESQPFIAFFTTASGQAEVVAKAAVVTGVCGVLSTVPVWSPLQALSLLVFMLAGPGSAAMCWVDIAPAATVAAVVGISIASVLGFAAALAWLGMWLPVPSCLLVSAVVVSCGFARLRSLRRSMTESSRSW